MVRSSDLIFQPSAPCGSRASWGIGAAALVVLYLIGVFHWVFFLNYGDLSPLLPSTLFPDWRKEFFYYTVLREAITEGVVPYTVSDSYHNSKFLGNLEPVFSPQILLLPLMSVGRFVLVNVLLMYSLGYLGCLLIRHRYRLSLISFTVLFLLFNFNGHITAHISVGHSMWNGYFLLPFFVLLVLNLVQARHGQWLGTAVLLAFVLFGMLLQGSFHIYVWCLIFLALVGVFNRRLLSAASLAVVFSVWLSLFRLLPAVFGMGGFRGSYASGFPTLSTFIDALTTIKAHAFEHPRGPLYDVGWWEHDVYIGIIGVLVIAYFGIYLRFSNRAALQVYKYQALDPPLVLLTLFSFGVFFDFISDLRVPLLSWAERVPSRMFIVPLVFLVVISSIRMQELLREVQVSPAWKLVSLAGVGLLAHSLMVHSWFWRIPDAALQAEEILGIKLNDPSWYHAAYSMSVKVSAFISLAAVVFLLWLYYWHTVRQRRGSP